MPRGKNHRYSSARGHFSVGGVQAQSCAARLFVALAYAARPYAARPPSLGWRAWLRLRHSLV